VRGSGANEVVKRILYGIGGSEEVVQAWREWWRLVATTFGSGAPSQRTNLKPLPRERLSPRSKQVKARTRIFDSRERVSPFAGSQVPSLRPPSSKYPLHLQWFPNMQQVTGEFSGS
jgi:hypothetical protein